jgi:hypothetical protein
MMIRSKTLRPLLIAGVAVFGLLAFRVAPASAHDVYTRCDEDGDRCWQVICDDDGDDCHPIHQHEYYADRERPRWICDDDGDRCHWAYPRLEDHEEFVPGAFFGFRLHN